MEAAPSLEDMDELLKTSTGIDFEKNLTAAFKYIGFKAIWLDDENDANPDIILEAWRCSSPYVVAIECYAQISETAEVTKDKVGQIRANGPKLLQNPEYDGKIENLFLCVVARGNFSRLAIKASGNDVVLINLGIILGLIQDVRKGIIYSQEELIQIFQGSGERNEAFNKFRHKKYTRYMSIGLLCYIAKNSLKKRKSGVDQRLIIGKSTAILEQNGIELSEYELAMDLEFLCHPITSLFSRKNGLITHHELNNPKSFQKLGKVGKIIYNWYLYWKKQLKPQKIDIAVFNST